MPFRSRSIVRSTWTRTCLERSAGLARLEADMRVFVEGLAGLDWSGLARWRAPRGPITPNIPTRPGSCMAQDKKKGALANQGPSLGRETPRKGYVIRRKLNR